MVFMAFPKKYMYMTAPEKRETKVNYRKRLFPVTQLLKKKIVLGHYIVILFTQNHQILIAAAEDRIRTLIKK